MLTYTLSMRQSPTQIPYTGCKNSVVLTEVKLTAIRYIYISFFELVTSAFRYIPLQE